jgi:hypothetical protein
MEKDEALDALVAHATARAFASGLGLVPPSREPGLLIHAPFALLPRQVGRIGASVCQASSGSCCAMLF